MTSTLRGGEIQMAEKLLMVVYSTGKGRLQRQNAEITIFTFVTSRTLVRFLP